MSTANSFHLFLPPGTQVVIRAEVRGPDGAVICPRGAAGVIVAAPDDRGDRYRVRLPNGEEVQLQRSEMSILKHYQRGDLAHLASELADVDLYDCVIYRCVIGSRAYGLEQADSDVDWRGIYLPPADLHWSLYGAPEQLENDATQEAYWELQKFMVLALKANPNVLECLYTPLVELATPLAQELLAMRAIFLSRFVYQTYNGYVLSQFKKLEQDLRVAGAVRWKHAMHLIRLLLSGITVLREGFVPLRVDEQRDHLLAVRRGEVAWDEVNAWRLRLHAEFDAAYASTHLAERPDYAAANDFLIKARRSAL